MISRMPVISARARTWLNSQLPDWIASGAITQENADAIVRRYGTSRIEGRRNVGFVILAILGSALIGAGIILLVAHNWDQFSRPLRSVIAFLPLISAQMLSAFVLWRRDQSQAWRESAAIFNVAAIGAVIALVSQTYQIHGSFANFILVWMLLSLPLVYLMRTTLGACAYLCGAVVWILQLSGFWGDHRENPLLFWLLLLLVIPYCLFVYRNARDNRATTALAVVFAFVTAAGIGETASFTQASLGALAFAGFFSAIYLCGIGFFPAPKGDRLHPLALLGGVAIGILTIVLTFEEIWTHSNDGTVPHDLARNIGVSLELAFPALALLLAVWSFLRSKIHFSFLAAALPAVTGLGWLLAHFCLPEHITWSHSRCDFAASILFDVYALALGVELIARGLRAESTARSNFGLLILAALAGARFFDSDLSFVTRAAGFIVIGLGFLLTNFLLFRRRRAS